MRLLQIRHGQTPHNVAGALDTAFPGDGLTPLGLTQAAAVPAALADERIGAVYASPLVRTQLTAAPLAEARGLTIDVRPGLEEVSAGDLELRTDTDAVGTYAETLISWMRGDLGRRMPGGENGHDFLARYDAAIRTLAERHGPDDTIVVVGHGAAMRVHTALRAGLDPRTSVELEVMNTGLGLLEGDPDRGWQLVRWRSEPLGGAHLADDGAQDVTGESAEDAVDEQSS
ncbi:histidine phosphatase family protein [Cellulomonas sp. ATA003]|uniref:histidine phosphatase family protein n=1 Tax=Cellulomonas sp. ATA003 TaxID=3073064 RepID=UPI0028737E87|nr:histidine phosphatase family protein [Cellulomonas sp. ATA003]WNB86904.1 histidine phosphatase family protein [Cellulomonas sp. ATA003]